MMATLSIAAVGDVMCGESFYNYGRGPRTYLAERGAAYLDQELIDVLRRHDLAFGNLECVLSDVGRRPGRLRSEHMRGAPQTAALLRAWGFNVFNLANNHILEHGHDAARDTAAHLRQAGVTLIGAGRDDAFGRGAQCVELTCGGARVGLLGACLLDEKYAYDGGADAATCLALCRELAARCELVVVSLHWGSEFVERPTSAQIELAHQFVDAGARLLLGHHPHVVQGLERRDGALIAYSLGNFIFDQPFSEARWAIMLSATFDAGQCVACSARPIVLDTHHAPRRAAADADLQREIERRTALVSAGAPADMAAYRRAAHARQRTFRRSMWAHLGRSFWRFPLRYQAQLLSRPLLRRLGRW